MSEDTGFKKLHRITDQSITAHSILRDRYSRRSTMLDVSLLVLSAMITFMSFASKDIIDILLPVVMQNKIALPVVSLLLFVVAIVELRVGWKAKFSSHGEAAKALAQFKHELTKTISIKKNCDDADVQTLTTNYQYVNSSIVKIPDDMFLQLKKAHKKKIEISKLLDSYPGALIPILEIKIFFRDNFGMKCLEKTGNSNGTSTKISDYEEK